MLHEEVLAPQFASEAAGNLPWYVLIEKVLLLEYVRMGVLSAEEAGRVAAALAGVTPEVLAADPETNMSDLAFALERLVTARLTVPVPQWHVDRSRNDLQACAHLMAARAELLESAAALLQCARAAHALAGRHTTSPMPGYTHLQAAQVMTPGLHFSALSAALVHTLGRLLATYDGIDLSPLGAGAMTGQELPFDRARMAKLLGFAAAQPHPLVAVASRAWQLEIAAELSMLGLTLSRFVTDLMTWGGSEHGFIDLPDELSAISSAMPQKKNFPILERIRGRAAVLTGGYLDIALIQRATPFANSVEVAKEGGGQLCGLWRTARSVLRLLTAVLENLTCRERRMKAACEEAYLGAFSLANLLTLRQGVPWRTAQVIVGEYVVAAPPPSRPDPALLNRVGARHGHPVRMAKDLLVEAFDPERDLARKSLPSTVRRLLAQQEAELKRLSRQWDRRGATALGAADRIEEELRACRTTT